MKKQEIMDALLKLTVRVSSLEYSEADLSDRMANREVQTGELRSVTIKALEEEIRDMKGRLRSMDTAIEGLSSALSSEERARRALRNELKEDNERLFTSLGAIEEKVNKLQQPELPTLELEDNGRER